MDLEQSFECKKSFECWLQELLEGELRQEGRQQGAYHASSYCSILLGNFGRQRISQTYPNWGRNWLGYMCDSHQAVIGWELPPKGRVAQAFLVSLQVLGALEMSMSRKQSGQSPRVRAETPTTSATFNWASIWFLLKRNANHGLIFLSRLPMPVGHFESWSSI